MMMMMMMGMQWKIKKRLLSLFSRFTISVTGKCSLYKYWCEVLNWISAFLFFTSVLDCMLESESKALFQFPGRAILFTKIV